MTTLGDIGERRLIAEFLVPRYSREGATFGDDCSLFPHVPAGAYVVGTTDPCPEPAAGLIGRASPEAYGHLLATINLSDLGAAGAEPIGLLISLELPPETQLTEFLELLDGIDRCCEAAGTSVLGGNLKEGPRRSATGFAVGACDGPPLSRSGAKPGDHVVVLGSLGLAWARLLAHLHEVRLSHHELQRAEDALVWPRPLVRLGRSLRHNEAVHACIDASDGAMAAIEQLAGASHVGVEMDFDGIEFDPAVVAVAETLGIHPWAIGRAWGDWQLVCAVSSEKLHLVEALAMDDGCAAQVVGRFTEGERLIAKLGGATGDVNVVDSERFVHARRPLLDWYPEALVMTPVLRPGATHA